MVRVVVELTFKTTISNKLHDKLMDDNKEFQKFVNTLKKQLNNDTVQVSYLGKVTS